MCAMDCGVHVICLPPLSEGRAMALEHPQTHACNTVLIPSLPLSPPAWLGVAWPSELFSSVAQSCPTLCNHMDCSTPGFPVHHQLPELAQTHVRRVSDAIQPCHPLSPTSSPAFTLS